MPYSSYFLRSDLFKRALLEGEIPELRIRGREGKNLLVKRLEKMRALRRSAHDGTTIERKWQQRHRVVPPSKKSLSPRHPPPGGRLVVSAYFPLLPLPPSNRGS